ncbi:MAG TPA: hypothetical protein VFO40_04865, partial [Chthoniobacterales bacterium]|nr:hypothetical protein [Chthoniobacterales bacterium]
VTGLALYASKDGKADRYVCFGIKECVEFAAKQGLPPKKFAELMGEALSHGPANEVKRYLPAEQIASPGTLAAMRSRK